MLRAAGHAVYTPTLTGLADRSHLIGCGVNLTTHVTDVVNLLFYEDLSNVASIGSSADGCGVYVSASATAAQTWLTMLTPEP